MHLDSNTAVIDNDFIGHVTDSHLTDDTLSKTLSVIFSELGLFVVVHPLVYDNEVQQEKPRIQLLFQKKLLSVADFSDIFLNDPDRKAYYLYLVKELYHGLYGRCFPFCDEEILTRWIRRQSLGEIHSISMCLVCKSGIFLSDDGDARRLKSFIERKSMGSISIYNRSELVDRHMQEGITKIPRLERKSLTHIAKNST